MTLDLEKLETMRDFLGITSIIFMVVSAILIFSLIFVTAKIRTISREKIENTRPA
jgi:hypothetical protein